MNERPRDADSVVAWLRRTAMPIEHLEAAHGSDDLQPLASVLDGVTVVGLGEATHGTREFFQLKHRLTKYLVEEMGFTAFALESSHAACEPINEYVLNGSGDRAQVLSDQGYLAWDTEEFSGLIDWLRAHNARVAPDQRVSFHGLDLNYNERGRTAVLAFVGGSMPDVVAEAEVILAVIAREEARWPLGIDDTGRAALRAVTPQLDALIHDMTAQGPGSSAGQSMAAWESAVRHAEVMVQWVHWITTDPEARSQRMGENLIHLVDVGAVGKVVFWAHNVHVATGGDRADGPSAGSLLRERYGPSYFAIGFECGDGAYTTRLDASEDRLGGLTVADLPPANPGSLPWTLTGAGIGNVLIPLRVPAAGEIVEAWRRVPLQVHNASWLLRLPTPTEVSIQDNYDAIAFVVTTSPTRPTPMGARRASEGLGL